MNWHPSIIGNFFLVTTLFAVIVAYRASRRIFPGKDFLVLFIGSAAVWTLTSALEWYSVEAETKAFWSQLSYIGIVNVSPAWLCYSLVYCGYPQLLTQRNLLLLWIIPAVTLALALTNSWHGLNWPAYYMVEHPLGNYMFYEHGPSFWVLTVYCYIVNITYSVLMVRQSRRLYASFRMQSLILFFTVSLPWIGNILYNARIVTVIDLTPAAFTVTGALLLWNMQQFRLFDITPIAREQLFAEFRQIAIVLDAQQRVVDMNPFALNSFSFARSPIGKPVGEVFPFWPQLLSFLRADNIAELELKLEHQGEPEWYLVSRTPLTKQRGSASGTLLICRNITMQKQRDDEREMLIAELQEALASVKTLGGLLPICASCKKIRDDEGYWSQVEQYIAKHTDAKFTHGICPDCGKKALEEYYRAKQQKVTS
ncbi:MAG: PAS domain-containing protein [Bacteroidetes bacterium]|nr:PAS domain-containing protein [Bacteroidota bacterium]